MITNLAQFHAWELATRLNDKKHFGFYVKLCKKYSSTLLLGLLYDLEKTKHWKNVKNKGAYYTTSLFRLIEDFKKF